MNPAEKFVSLRAMRAALLLSFLAIGCASTHASTQPSVRVASLEQTAPHPTRPKNRTDQIGTAVILTTVGAGLATAGAMMLVCNGGGLGCFGGQADTVWARPPAIERTVIPVAGIVLFVAGATALLMVPMWAALDLARD